MSKRRKPTTNKQRVPEKNKQTPTPENGSKQALQDLSGQVQTALALLSSEEADAIIGSRGVVNPDNPTEYQRMIQAAKAVMTMNWMAAKSCGMRETQTSLQYGAQSMTIVLDLVHKAYALGLRAGQEEQDG